jgi:DNA-binding LacI/PurR family transcriptional regulator
LVKSEQFQATYLLDKGHQRLAVATSQQSIGKEIHREAIRQVCSEYGIEPPVTIAVPERRAALQRILAALLSENLSPLAICAADDETAIAVLAALADLSIPVLESLAAAIFLRRL